MKTEHKFAQALKSLMSDKPLDQISVLSLTKRCHVNRQTFYYHFHDIYDLLTLVYLDERIKGIELTKNTTEMVKVIFEYYQENYKFIDATLASAGKDLVNEFFYNACYQSCLRFVDVALGNKKMIASDKKSIARFYASAYSNSIIYYLNNFKNKSFNNLMNTFKFLDEHEIEKSVNSLLKVRKD